MLLDYCQAFCGVKIATQTDINTYDFMCFFPL